MSKKTEITITIEGARGRVPYASFETVLANTIGLLKSIAETVGKKEPTDLSWQITHAKMRSPLTITLEGTCLRKTLPNRAIRDCIGGIRQIEDRAELPPNFTNNDLDLLSKIVNVQKDGVKSLKLSSPEYGNVIPTLRLMDNVQKIPRRDYYYQHTTIRGRLLDIHMSKGAREFTIFDLLTDRQIRCVFKEGKHKNVARLLQQNVVVYGRTKFNNRGIPESMIVDEFQGLPIAKRKVSELPPIDITGGMGSVEFVRRIRNGEAI